jgi:hypothetical protein
MLGWAGTMTILALSPHANAQNAVATQLQKQIDASSGQMRSLEEKMPWTRTPAPSAPIEKPAAPEPEIFSDKKIHLGGVTVTPGGFLELQGLQR